MEIEKFEEILNKHLKEINIELKKEQTEKIL